ncbi:MAG: response regulator [Gammaproteobacteria bacterium]|nr:response regulator [Gammaproteobacteria bacterium]
MIPAISITFGDLSVALVEPSITQQHIIVKHLATLGVTNTICYQDKASALAGINDSVPDLMISAMHFPDGTGTELAQALRKDPRTEDLLFMLVSSETAYRYLDPLKQAGVIAILPKPFQASDLRKALNTTLDFLLPEENQLNVAAVEEMKVLVVDDSVTARHHIRRVLNNMGIMNVTEVANGRDAIEQIKQNFYDLIVTDYNMPEVDGQQLTRYVREKSTQRSVPILMVTSVTDETRLAQVQQCGVSAICDKPFEPSGIKNLVRKMLLVD